MSGKDRVAAHKARQIEMGRVRRYIFATPDEHTWLNTKLRNKRSREPKSQ